MYTTWQTSPGGGWAGFASLGGVVTTLPVITNNADGRFELFARDRQRALASLAVGTEQRLELSQRW